MKKNLSLIIIILIFLLSGCSMIASNYDVATEPGNDEPIIVQIPKGSSTSGIAQILLNNGLILNEKAFSTRAQELGMDVKFQAGQYSLNKSMDMSTIIDIIGNGKVFKDTFTFTIPEGYELNQIKSLLEEKGYINIIEFEKALDRTLYDFDFLNYVEGNFNFEGYLFPATYTFEKGTSEIEIINEMLKSFNNIFKEEYYSRLEELNMSLNQVITLASIIEREASVDKDRPLISSVFHNRLAEEIPLGSCATIQYILGERKAVLTIADTQIKSDYNTYIYKGLPPAPIASPGEESIRAALYPDETDYLYFQVDYRVNDGTHFFAKTLKEHEDFKRTYR